METIEIIQVLSDIGTVGLLLLILWQGLLRFDRLLTLVITLAARAALSQAEIEELRAHIGMEGKGKPKA